MTDFFARHQERLNGALEAIRRRTFWSAFSESAKTYGDLAQAEEAFKARLNKPFDFSQRGTETVSGERSPYGFALGISYPRADVSQLVANAQGAARAWRRTGLEERIGVCLEILDRINQRSLEMAHAIMHTTGQPLMMAFQAAGPHAQERGLEAIAYAYDAMRQVPAETVRWEKPQGKAEPIRLDKVYHIVPRGIGLVIGCATFPTWNGYPGMFASLATGNVVILKPHPTVVLPLALAAATAREVLAEAGLPEDVVQLAVDSIDRPVAQELALRPEVGIIDFTGSSTFGRWLEDNARQAQVYTEKAGVNFVVVDSPPDFDGMLKNLAFSLSLYSGQMCTTPQNIWVPKDGIDTPQGHLSFDDVAGAVAKAVDGFLSAPERAVEILGAIQSEATAARIEEAKGLGEVLLASKTLSHPKYPDARIRTPMILKARAGQNDSYGKECFGPVTFVIAAESTDAALAQAAGMAKEKGAITAAVYSSNSRVLEKADELCAEAGVALSCNLTGNIYVNQSAAFSDFHATGANPAANASLTDTAFVANRFRVVQSRQPAAA